MQPHYSLDEEISAMVKDYLDEKDITSQILNITFFEPLSEPHAFVIASYPSGNIDKINKILIDPLFEMVATKNNIKPTVESEALFENLKENGITFANQNELYKYILLFYKNSLKRQIEKTQYYKKNFS